MLLTLGSPDPYGYPECLAPQIQSALKRKELLIVSALSSLQTFSLFTSSFVCVLSLVWIHSPKCLLSVTLLSNQAHQDWIITRKKDKLEGRDKCSSAKDCKVVYKNEILGEDLLLWFRHWEKKVLQYDNTVLAQINKCFIPSQRRNTLESSTEGRGLWR